MTRKQKNTQMCKCAKEGGVNEIKDKKKYVLCFRHFFVIIVFRVKIS